MLHAGSLMLFSNGNRSERSPSRSVIIAERESNLFPRVMITDKIGRHEVLSQIYYKTYNFCLKEQLLLK